MLIFRELETTRSIRQKDPLARFFRSQSRWELLLLIAANKKSEEIGIWNYIDMLTTRTESPMTIYTFIRDRIDDGSIVMLPGRKKSRKILSLSPQLEAALNEFLIRRYIVGMPHQDPDDPYLSQEPLGVVPVTNFGQTGTPPENVFVLPMADRDFNIRQTRPPAGFASLTDAKASGQTA